MGLLLRAVPPSKLQRIEGMNATCNHFLSYSSRHMARVDSLLQKTYLFDAALQLGGQGLALQDDAEAALKRTMAVLYDGDADEMADLYKRATSDSSGDDAPERSNAYNESTGTNASNRRNDTPMPKPMKRKKIGKA